MRALIFLGFASRFAIKFFCCGIQRLCIFGAYSARPAITPLSSAAIKQSQRKQQNGGPDVHTAEPISDPDKEKGRPANRTAFFEFS